MIDKNELIEFEGKYYDSRHGGPFDRGMADSYYGRAFRPHFFIGNSNSSPEVTLSGEDPKWLEYEAGYNYNEFLGDKKNWG
jgi:hypothetical protein